MCDREWWIPPDNVSKYSNPNRVMTTNSFADSDRLVPKLFASALESNLVVQDDDKEAAFDVAGSRKTL